MNTWINATVALFVKDNMKNIKINKVFMWFIIYTLLCSPVLVGIFLHDSSFVVMAFVSVLPLIMYVSIITIDKLYEQN